MKKLKNEIKMFLKPTTIDLINNIEDKKIKEVEFYANRYFTVGEIMDIPLPQMSIALHNFIARRLDYFKNSNEDALIYYGHLCDGLGYYIADDEIAFKHGEIDD